MGKTYYDVLEVDPDATEDQIQDAYRERVLETHPDHNDAPDAAEQFQRVSTAESILTDETERARYDRLEHDAYVRLAEHAGQTTADSSHDSDDDSGPSGTRGGKTGRTVAESDSRGKHSTRASSGRQTSGSSSNRYATSGTSRRHASGTSVGGRDSSHHARQRWRRQREKARQTSADRFTTGTSADTGRKRTARTNTDRVGSTRATTDETGGATAESDGSSSFRYTVKDWDGDVDLEWDGRSIEHSTAVTLVCIWLLYPVLVYTSVTPLVSPVFNGILVLCTLGIVAYLLTMPRIATALFGSWAVVLPVGFAGFSLVDPLSLRGLLAIGFVWIPLGYAMALWWALRP
ncbi:DnaJ domain-containing protein [Natrialba sp. INN-245]|uniref:DnaJ domain-containing protein n=1 Tax=Natrialba sp. INN-245 TaxID=2690967 RepID=UPI001312BB05|nr:DnaJ domain-containing protein [Natrialba sp. INN-245]MWV41106.1 DnaJ domain-containing protein [Natrialba sp. INN-245]